jgi:hypothetical protein
MKKLNKSNDNFQRHLNRSRRRDLYIKFYDDSPFLLFLLKNNIIPSNSLRRVMAINYDCISETRSYIIEFRDIDGEDKKDDMLIIDIPEDFEFVRRNIVVFSVNLN